MLDGGVYAADCSGRTAQLLRLIKPDIGEASGRQLALPADAEHCRTNYLHTAP
jgi:hypothetical protein